MCSTLDENNKEMYANKGHNAFTEFQEFYDKLFQKKIFRHTLGGIKSNNHNLRTYESDKKSLSFFDDK